MVTATREQLAADIDQLPLPDQLWLMEQLAHRIRQRTLLKINIDEQALIDMANDPAIQQELQLIATEFATTETDGLDQPR